MKIEDPDLDTLSVEWANGSPEVNTGLRIQDVPSIFTFDERSIEWAVYKFIAMGAVTLVSGDSGLLKSTLLTVAGRRGADGDEFAGMETTKRPWVILDRGENGLGTVQERYRRLGFEDGNGLRHYGAWLGDVPTPSSPLTLEYVTATNPKPVIVVDALISHIEGDENSSVETRAFMRPIRHLATLGAGVVIIHHSGKAESAKKYRGSSDIKASVDVAYEVEGAGDPTRLERLKLTAFKSRFATQQVINLHFDGSQFWSDAPAQPTRTVTQQLRDLLIANPGIKTADFCSLAVVHKLGRDRARAFLTEGRKSRLIHALPGAKNAEFNTWIDAQNGHQNGSFSL